MPQPSPRLATAPLVPAERHELVRPPIKSGVCEVYSPYVSFALH